MFRSRIKITIVIFIYSILITITFLFLTLYLQKTMEDININQYMEETSDQYAIRTDEVISNQITNDKTEIILRAAEINNFKAYSTEQLFNVLLPASILFCIFIVMASTLLWYVMKRIKSKDNQLIVKEIQSIEWAGQLPMGNNELLEAYRHIRSVYERHMEEFKRLNSYLSHDQRNTLMLLRNNLEQGKTEAGLRNIQILSDSIDDILTLSDHPDEERLTPVDVILLCADICDSYKQVYPQLHFQFPEAEEFYILAKPRWIRQAVSNLIDNAIKYGNDKSVLVEIRKVKDSIVIKVEDHGIGIDLAMQERIFEHRYRVDELNKDGYGIGLNLVLHVCDLCEGFVYCDSEKEKGTSFYMSFQSIA